MEALGIPKITINLINVVQTDRANYQITSLFYFDTGSFTLLWFKYEWKSQCGERIAPRKETPSMHNVYQ